MSLTSGARLGPYQLGPSIGAGGMGEVYRARDSRLGRDVAIKILPTEVADDPDRLRRFEQEARAAASLNHPNILSVHDVGNDNGVAYLVTELLEGRTLREEMSAAAGLKPTPYIRTDRALDYAVQIADGLAAAHARGIVHRDLKPENIFVTTDGRAKILDFGLATVVTTDPYGGRGFSPGGHAGSEDPASETALSPAHTASGVILGTVGYMAPEQIRGQAVDARTDIFAFGCVLYEMLAGRRAFEGDTPFDTLSAILKDTPAPLIAPPPAPAIPTQLSRIVERCLEKAPIARFQTALDLAFALKNQVVPSAGSVRHDEPASGSHQAGVSRRRERLLWAVGTGGIAIVAALLIWSPWRHQPDATPRRVMAALGADATAPTFPVLSPDGTTVAFVAQPTGQTQRQIFVRKLDQLQATALVGTTGGTSPFFSPDGEWIAFFADGLLKKIPRSGGTPLTLCPAPSGRGGTWVDDNAIVFSPERTSPLMRVSPDGGTPAPFGTFGEGGSTQRWPQALPGGRGVIYTERLSPDEYSDAAFNVVVAPLAGGPPKVVVTGGYMGRYVPSGHLLYMRQGILVVVRFDLDRLEAIGEPVPAVEGLMFDSPSGFAHVAFSSEGGLVYVPREAGDRASPIAWLTRDGNMSVLRAKKAEWGNPRFSPNGEKLAIEIFDGIQRDIWVYDWARDTLTRVTNDPGQDRAPVWTLDNRRIVFASDRGTPGISSLYWVSADGRDDPTRLTDGGVGQTAWSWHPSEKFLAFQTLSNTQRWDLMILPMLGDATRGWTPGVPTVFLSTPERESSPMFSPDGRWIAYHANEIPGMLDVFVRPFPGPGGKVRVSTAGAIFPRWSAIAPELLFMATQFQIMSAPYAVVGDVFRAERPRVWSPTAIRGVANYEEDNYDLHPDGTRLAVMPRQEQSTVVHDKIVFVFNFFDHLRKIAPGNK